MIITRRVGLFITMLFALNSTYATMPEEQTQKPSSATRIAQLKERALKFGRCFAGTKEYTSEETQLARAKTIGMVAVGLFCLLGWCYIKPCRFSPSDKTGVRKGNTTPSSTPKDRTKTEIPTKTGIPKDTAPDIPKVSGEKKGDGKEEENKPLEQNTPYKSEYPGWTGATDEWLHSLWSSEPYYGDPHGTRPELQGQEPDKQK